MLPQTNLQLYRLLLERGACEDDLALVRCCYDAACRMTSGRFRPSAKPFIAHLVGTAGALVRWGQRAPMIVAGLLHSAYLQGDFADGRRGAASARRRWLRSVAGEEAESLVAEFTDVDWRTPLPQLIAEAATQPRRRDVLVLKLADQLDELSDAGPRFATGKRLSLDPQHIEGAATALAEAARIVLGPAAGDDFDAALELIERLAPPPALQTREKSSYAVRSGIEQLRRSSVHKKLIRLGQRLRIAGR